MVSKLLNMDILMYFLERYTLFVGLIALVLVILIGALVLAVFFPPRKPQRGDLLHKNYLPILFSDNIAGHWIGIWAVGLGLLLFGVLFYLYVKEDKSTDER